MSRTGGRPTTRMRSGWQWVLASGLLSACGGDQSTLAAPQPDISVEMSGSVSSPYVQRVVLPPGVRLECEVALTADVSGAGTGTWLDGFVEFFDLRDTTRSIGTVSLQASELKSAWGQDTITPGQAGSRWRVTGSAAFAATFRMRYQTGFATRASATSLRCAPPAGAVAPSITTLSVSPSSGTINVLTPINVTFTASTPAGAFHSVVRATGACSEAWGVAESVTSSVSRNMPLTLGWPCQLGVPIGVEVVVYDAVGNSDTRRVATSVTMRDDKAPTVRTFFWNRAGVEMVSPLGDHLASDTLYADVIAKDNYRVDALFLEIYPFGISDTLVVRDSFLTRSPSDFLALEASHRFLIRFRPEWAGTKLQYRFYSRDVQGLLSNVYTTERGCVRIITSTPNSPATPTTCIYDWGDDPLTTPVLSATPASRAVLPMSGAVLPMSEPRSYEARFIP